MKCILWMLFAGGVLAQTPPSSEIPAKATAPRQSAVPSPAPSPAADKAPADQPGAIPAGVIPPGAIPAGAAKTAAVEKRPEKSSETFESAMAKQRAAVAVQRAVVRQQMQMAVEWQLGSPRSEASDADCDPIADPELTPLIGRAAQDHQVEPKLLRGVIERESGFRACATSPKGARGLMQLMPATIEQFKVEDAFDPRQNVEAGATYLRQLLDKYKGDLTLALAAYNAGPAVVDKAGGIPEIKETQDYVESIMKKMK